MALLTQLTLGLPVIITKLIGKIWAIFAQDNFGDLGVKGRHEVYLTKLKANKPIRRKRLKLKRKLLFCILQYYLQYNTTTVLNYLKCFLIIDYKKAEISYFCSFILIDRKPYFKTRMKKNKNKLKFDNKYYKWLIN
ncbi:hypothetical protein BpHYR1_054086 [Brachionus plicatilis]|uniref:Uncharacterized protein n=1 Tax=Brachionus plicatilis TaxID=10195 RepID=A0A3M7RXW5_BRAPC|nr:hypothetical protein BpHYR1_054086 [Brachionus plicatilis]